MFVSELFLLNIFMITNFLITAINVVIGIFYNPPTDFDVPSPPYYRPATSVTLTCSATPNSARSLRYEWSSTCSSCIVSGNTSRELSIDILKSSDAGIHSCTVTDAEGHSGHASSEMILIGVFILDSEKTNRQFED